MGFSTGGGVAGGATALLHVDPPFLFVPSCAEKDWKPLCHPEVPHGRGEGPVAVAIAVVACEIRIVRNFFLVAVVEVLVEGRSGLGFAPPGRAQENDPTKELTLCGVQVVSDVVHHARHFNCNTCSTFCSLDTGTNQTGLPSHQPEREIVNRMMGSRLDRRMLNLHLMH